MFKGNFHRPVIIIGMHRSGTSLVAKLLHEAGINMGEERDHNEESLPFLNVNQEIMHANGNDWLEPGEILDTQAPESAMSMYVNHFKINPEDYQFLGKPRPAFIRWFHDKRWGFKDPRNSFTLPIWLSLFPNAKVIHVVRNPISVVQSLMKRNTVSGEVFDHRLNNPEFCLQLWAKYVQACVTQGSKLPSESFFQLKYEDLIHQPNTISRLSNFVNQDLSHSYSAHLQTKPAHADLELDLSSVKNLMSKCGYTL